VSVEVRLDSFLAATYSDHPPAATTLPAARVDGRLRMKLQVAS
jgi:hypothetical protein